MLDKLNLNSVFLMTLGLLLAGYGAWYFYRYRDYTWAAGLISLGIGNGLFGFTNGFTDMTPTGRILVKFGILTLILGILIVGYVLSKTL